MVYQLLFYFFISAGLGFCEKRCPRNSLYFDYEPCDPNRRSQCPTGFTCRKGEDTEKPEVVLYLCCESAGMTAAEWFAEAQIAPQVFPQSPLSIFNDIRLYPVQQNEEFPPIHIGDEIVVLTYPNFATGIVGSVTINNTLSAGYYHVMTIVDPGFSPYALFFSYNIPCPPTSTINLILSNQASNPQRFVTFVDNSTTVPLLESYRALYVVLAFRTNSPLYFSDNTLNGDNTFITGQSLMNGCKDVTCLLTNTDVGRNLGQPVGGSLFYLTTKRSMFPTGQIPQRDSASSYLSLILLSAQLYILL